MTNLGEAVDDAFALELGRRIATRYQSSHPSRRLSDLGRVDDVAARVVAVLPQLAPSSWAAAVGPVYRTEQVRHLLGGVSRQALLDRVKRQRLLSLRTADGHLVWPAWQFQARLPLPGLADVLRLLDREDVDDWTLASWLNAPQEAAAGRNVADLIGSDDPADLELARQLTRRASSRWGM